MVCQLFLKLFMITNFKYLPPDIIKKGFCSAARQRFAKTFLFALGTCPSSYSNYTSINVSRAIASSSFVGIAITFTFESEVEIITSSPLILFISRSIAMPK